MPVGITSGTKVLVWTRPGNPLPLKGVTSWTTGGGERSATPVQHLNTDDGTLSVPGDPSVFTIDIPDATAVMTHETWLALSKAFGDPSRNISPSPILIALLNDGVATNTYTVAAEIGVTLAVTGADYTGATGKYYRMGLATLAGTKVGDSSKEITRLADAGIETGKQIEIGSEKLSVAEIVSDTDTSKTFRVTDPSGAAVAAVGTATGFKTGDPVECYGVSSRTAPTGFPCTVLNPGTPSRSSGERRVVTAQLTPVANRLPNPTLVAFQ